MKTGSWRLLNFKPKGLSPNRVRVRGVVTWSRPGEGVYLQDGPFGVRVRSRSAVPVLLGELAEPLGFAVMGECNAELREAILQTRGGAWKVAARRVDPESEARKDGFDATLVEVDGTVQRLNAAPDSHGMLLASGSKLIEATLWQTGSLPWRGLREGSRVRVQRYLPPAISMRVAEGLCSRDLSALEIEVLRLLSKGFTNNEIGSLLQVSAFTAKAHMQNTIAKLQVSSRTEATIVAMNRGLPPLTECTLSSDPDSQR